MRVTCRGAAQPLKPAQSCAQLGLETEVGQVSGDHRMVRALTVQIGDERLQDFGAILAATPDAPFEPADRLFVEPLRQAAEKRRGDVQV